VTTQAGCALGALYTAFDDLLMLILHVNSRTLAWLGETQKAALPAPASDPEDTMQALAPAYVDFACANRALWSAMTRGAHPGQGADRPA